jgi:hypothetical protein
VVVGAGGRRGRRLLLLTGCLILGVLGLGTVEAHAATLAGETFTSHPASGSSLTGACTDNSNARSFNFSASGTAAGPFPGTSRNREASPHSPTATVSEFPAPSPSPVPRGPVTGSKHLAGALGKASYTFLPGPTQVISTSNLATTYGHCQRRPTNFRHDDGHLSGGGRGDTAQLRRDLRLQRGGPAGQQGAVQERWVAELRLQEPRGLHQLGRYPRQEPAQRAVASRDIRCRRRAFARWIAGD